MGRKEIDQQLYCHREKDSPGWRVLDKDFHIYGVTIPAGFRWNGASTPLLLTWLVPRFDHSLMSSCLHDYLCSNAQDEDDRKTADMLYKRALIEIEGYTEKRAKWAYRGVRIGAWWGTGVNYPHKIKDNIWPIIGV